MKFITRYFTAKWNIDKSIIESVPQQPIVVEIDLNPQTPTITEIDQRGNNVNSF